jgi:AP endonuclease 2
MIGYSGVVIYTRNATCAPIRSEEGITGILSPPNITTSFRDLPEEQQIGGYPTIEQLSQTEFDALTLDSEGRCVILEFPAFVLIGTYCPAERDETRTHFRRGFLQVLDSRIRNLVSMGKNVIWTGDINVAREEIDAAHAEKSMTKEGIDPVKWISTPARRLFNQLLIDGKVHGERDEGREQQIMWDICRGFHEGRKGMYTCWETKINARPGNYGARIDYVICSHNMKDWFADSNIQEGLQGSDHCPVFAVTKDCVSFKGQEKHILDIVNPPGMFVDGVRQREWAQMDLLPTSGKIIQEFDRRQNIRDMFTRTPSMPKTKAATETSSKPDASQTAKPSTSIPSHPLPVLNGNGKRPANADPAASPLKKTKSSSQTATSSGAKGQQSLKGFFVAKAAPALTASGKETSIPPSITSPDPDPTALLDGASDASTASPTKSDAPIDVEAAEAASFATKQSWGKLFSRPVAPKCEHEEPCKIMLTKKPGANCGRSFWMCNRPLGPTGRQERGTAWRCSTFIWASDWDTHAQDPG